MIDIYKKKLNMDASNKVEQWIEYTLPKHIRLTQAVVTITKNILRSREVEFLAIVGRIKDKFSILEKVMSTKEGQLHKYN